MEEDVANLSCKGQRIHTCTGFPWMLLDQELIESKKADESGYYAVPGGGTRRVVNGGEAVVDNNNYYVIQVDYMNDGSSVQATTYFGVNDQTGEVIRLNKSGMNFVIG